MSDQQSFTSPKRIEITYGTMKPIIVSPEEADRVQALLPGRQPLDPEHLEAHLIQKENDRKGRSIERVITVEDVRGNVHSLLITPGVTFAISRPNPERKARTSRATVLS